MHPHPLPLPVDFTPPGRLLDFMRQLGQTDLINLAAGIPAPGLLPVRELEAAFHAGVQRSGGEMFAYQVPEGDPELRQMIAERLNQRGVEVSGNDLIITTGCTQALHLLLSYHVRPGDVVAVEQPTYYGMLEILHSLGARALRLPTDPEHGLLLDPSVELMREHRPSCIVSCTSFCNPSGATLPERERERWVAFCQSQGIPFIEDDIYAELSDDAPLRPCRAFDDGSSVFFASSFCKSVSPGLRVGFVIPGKHFEEIANRKCVQDMHAAVTTQFTLREFIRNGDLDTHLGRLMDTCRDRRRRALATIAETFPKEVVVRPPRGGYMLWAECPSHYDINRIRAGALERKVSIAQGDVFYAGPPPVPAMRLNCARAEGDDLEKGFALLGEILAAET